MNNHQKLTQARQARRLSRGDAVVIKGDNDEEGAVVGFDSNDYNYFTTTW